MDKRHRDWVILAHFPKQGIFLNDDKPTSEGKIYANPM